MSDARSVGRKVKCLKTASRFTPAHRKSGRRECGPTTARGRHFLNRRNASATNSPAHRRNWRNCKRLGARTTGLSVKRLSRLQIYRPTMPNCANFSTVTNGRRMDVPNAESLSLTAMRSGANSRPPSPPHLRIRMRRKREVRILIRTVDVPLTQGKVALVDSDCVDLVAGVKWRAVKYANSYYAHRTVRKNGDRWSQYMHRLIMGVDDPKIIVDHINGNGLDNRRENLRTCSKAENQWNQFTIRSGTSRFKGVWWHKGQRKWKAAIRVNGRRKHLGTFESEIEAALAYDQAAIKMFGEFAKPNLAIMADALAKLEGGGGS